MMNVEKVTVEIVAKDNEWHVTITCPTTGWQVMKVSYSEENARWFACYTLMTKWASHCVTFTKPMECVNMNLITAILEEYHRASKEFQV
jgi:hypothetical protein